APAEPVVAAAPQQGAIARPAWRGFGRFAAGELGQRAIAQVAHEHVAVAHEGHARALRIQHRARGIDTGVGGAVDDPRLATGDLLHVDIADPAALALERVIGAAAVP